ncbi:hypothetical protein IEQ34_018129 [Dendrobium chrysotoxum]|uniref:non-specific serine/threonine protein kinase n=1 Tax=Dendrobium chrysotoxum TaxID=161865 RepID=A0AAV7GC83_DENCH|nr:hypothetical protein IEQ34_018129 [Dendrobium chrysotoxum]
MDGVLKGKCHHRVIIAIIIGEPRISQRCIDLKEIERAKFSGDYQFAINCGGGANVTSYDGTNFDIDNDDLSATSYFVTNAKNWAVSTTGSFIGALNPKANYIIKSQIQSQNTFDSKLFMTARMSPSSLRYYGLGLENGNYTVKLQFSEIGIPDQPTWTSLARRVFDIYIQGMLKEKDFDIRKEAGGKSFTVVLKEYQAPVTNNFLEIHLFWAGKGTTFIPNPGYYGPSISAISVSPYDFIPSVSNKPPHSSSSNNNTTLVVGIVCGVVVLGLTVFVILVWKHKQKYLKKDNEELSGMSVIPNTFSYSELRTATEDFNRSNFLGEGGFGPVFKGKLHDGRMVAVKQLSVASQQGESQFTAEIATISAVQHRNLAKLYGCCIEGDKRLLVYEYLENKSLDQAIFGKKDLHLDWKTRFEICLGVARGLAYLHEESSVRIIHRDVKSSNILLDGNLTPKISDFGLAKLYDDKWTHISTRVAGTIGYLAPEYAMRGHLTEKADVFGFGVVALEVLSGRRNSDPSLEEEQSYLLDWAWHLYEHKHELELVDPSLTSYNRDEATRVISVSLLCIQASPTLRPAMSTVVAMLAGIIEVNEVTSRPGYLTEWQFKDISSNFASDGFCKSTDTRPTTSQVSEPSNADTRASSSWNISGELCNGIASDSTNFGDFNPAIKCDCSFNGGTVCHVTQLDLGRNYLTGPLPAFIGSLSSLQYLYTDSSGLSGELPASLSKLTTLQKLWISDNDFTGKIPDFIGSWKNLNGTPSVVQFLQAFLVSPTFLICKYFPPLYLIVNMPLLNRHNFVKKIIRRIGDIINGSSSLGFISNMTSLSTLDLSFNNIIGNVPQSLLNLNSLQLLFLGNNNLLGDLPKTKSASLSSIDLSYNQLAGSFPSWVNDPNLELNLVANNFVIDNSNSSVLPSGLECLQRDKSCYHSQFGIKCGGSANLMSSDRTSYDKDNANLSTASYYVTDPIKWAVSNTGSFAGASNPNTNYIISSQTLSANTLDPELFQTARMSPSSLRYYGLGLENGNYTIKLQFSEIGLIDPPTWKSLGRRVFDIYIQAILMEKDFDIRKEAGGKSFTAVVKEYRAPVTNNFLEIHLFWAGKGTSFIPSQGYYGPSISAISVSPAFIPSVSNKAPNSSSSSNKTGLIVGIIAGVVVLGLLIFAILVWRQKQKNVNKDEEELLGMAIRPNTFSYAELRAATEDFNQSNLLGEGGFGSVYKGKLYDGRMVAVKQLSVASHHGKRQFMAEIAIISAVQQRNLVKLYGCCIEGDKRLLVYEYLKNKSLDKALFGKNGYHLNWRMRFEICLGTARGLAYLHEESSVKIIHRDVKSSNILLDSNLNPKISDFGLAKLYDDKKTHISTRVAGTIGYLAPEYAMRGHLTEKADVFGFGVVALEVLSGRPNSDSTLEEEKVYLLDWAWSLYEQKHELDLVDPILSSYNTDEAIRVFGVALLCIQASPALRPPMSRVVAMLAGDVEVNEVTSRPSYLTEWQFNDISSNFANDDCSRSTSTTLTNIQTSMPSDPSTVTYMGIDPSADVPLRNNSIGEGSCDLSPSREPPYDLRLKLMASSKVSIFFFLLCFFFLFFERCRCQASSAAKTDPIEAQAVNTILSRWVLTSSSSWNNSGDLCSGIAIDTTDIKNFNPGIKCDCSFNDSTVCHVTQLNLAQNYLTGPLPAFIGNLSAMQYLNFGLNALSGPMPKEVGNLKNLILLYMDSSGLSGELPASLSKLTNLQILRIGDLINGSSSLAFFSNLTSLSTMIIRNAKIADTLPSNFAKYTNLIILLSSFLFIPNGFELQRHYRKCSTVSTKLELSKSFRSIIQSTVRKLSNLGQRSKLRAEESDLLEKERVINLVVNNFVIDNSNNSVLPSGLECLQRNIPCYHSQFGIKCGGSASVTSSDGTNFDADNANLSTASYYVTNPIKWAVSNTGSFKDATNPNTNYIISTQSQFQNTLDPELFQTARMSPSSLRYYGLGLQNGNYTIKLQFAEIGIEDTPTWKSLGRRVFDIYIQGIRKEKDFNIRKEAGGKSFTAVIRKYQAPVTNNFLELHFFWAGKGTCCIPTQGYYGASISAISISPYDFTPTVSNRAPNSSSSSNKTGLVVGIVVGVVVVLGLVIFAIILWRHRQEKHSKDDAELLELNFIPNTFGYVELRAATQDFNQSNFLGEGGFGPVYKGKLYDGRMVAVKQLSVASHQGKRQFVTEIATISAVQHRNLVKLYGCCIEGDKRLLVYEYLEKKSLDQAIFGKNDLHLEWETRFEICLGAARGLAYLHEESSVRIVHRDVKSSNILLDENLNPKISDFGLAKLYDDKKTHISTRVAGTIGYLAPEYAMRGHLTEKADVFGFGVVALEILSGRPNSDLALEEEKVYLLDWAWHLYEEKHELDLVDPSLSSYNKDEAIRVIRVALLCIQALPALRPPMSRVVAMLVGDIEVNEVTSRPSYLTEWQFKDISSNFVNDNFSSLTDTRLADNQISVPSNQNTVIYMEANPSADAPLRHNSIEEGR